MYDPLYICTKRGNQVCMYQQFNYIKKPLPSCIQRILHSRKVYDCQYVQGCQYEYQGCQYEY